MNACLKADQVGMNYGEDFSRCVCKCSSNQENRKKVIDSYQIQKEFVKVHKLPEMF